MAACTVITRDVGCECAFVLGGGSASLWSPCVLLALSHLFTLSDRHHMEFVVEVRFPVIQWGQSWASAIWNRQDMACLAHAKQDAQESQLAWLQKPVWASGEINLYLNDFSTCALYGQNWTPPTPATLLQLPPHQPTTTTYIIYMLECRQSANPSTEMLCVWADPSKRIGGDL